MTNDELAKILAASVRDYVHYFGAHYNDFGTYELGRHEGKLEEWLTNELNKHVDDDY